MVTWDVAPCINIVLRQYLQLKEYFTETKKWDGNGDISQVDLERFTAAAWLSLLPPLLHSPAAGVLHAFCSQTLLGKFLFLDRNIIKGSESERKLNLFKYLGLFFRQDAIPDQYYEDPDDLETVSQ